MDNITANTALITSIFWIGVILLMIAYDFLAKPIKNKAKTLACSHEFSGKDMQYRDDRGLVVWPCCKCGKKFEAESGLEILKNGKCIGGWT